MKVRISIPDNAVSFLRLDGQTLDVKDLQPLTLGVWVPKELHRHYGQRSVRGERVDLTYNFVTFVEATKEQFVEIIATAEHSFRFGLWRDMAKSALKDNKVDLYVEHWLEQDDDPGSRPMVQKMLTNGLYEVLQSFRN